MKQRVVRRGVAAVALLATSGLMAACTPPTPPPTQSFQWAANSVTINDSNDKGVQVCVPFTDICTWVPPDSDEPYVVHIGFKVTIGEANSATTQVVIGANHWPGLIDQGPSTGQTHNYSGGEKGALTLSDVPLLDVGDLTGGAKLTLAGVWAWAMEADSYSPGGINASADVLKTALNSLASNTTLPTDTSGIVSTILNAIGGVGGVFTFLGANLGSIFFGDDAIGSKLYIGVGARGALSDIITSSAAGIAFPSIDVPVASVPPDIRGGAIFSLGAGSRNFNGQSHTNGGVGGRHTNNYSLTAL